jgi:hypothetical protein
MPNVNVSTINPKPGRRNEGLPLSEPIGSIPIIGVGASLTAIEAEAADGRRTTASFDDTGDILERRSIGVGEKRFSSGEDASLQTESLLVCLP